MDTTGGAAAPAPDELRITPLLAHLLDEQLAWIAGKGRVVRLAAGEVIARQGDPADGFYIVLEGETEWTRRVGGREVHAVTLGAGTIFAELILLLDAPYPTTGRALTAVRLLKLEPDAFWEMLAVCPAVLRGVVRVAVERSQIHESVSQQQAKLIGLGTMAAGLAHELNNPAAAVSRGANLLGRMLPTLAPAALALAREIEAGQREYVAGLPDEVTRRAGEMGAVDTLARSDAEEDVAAWLEAQGVDDAWQLASTLAGAGLDPDWLDTLAERVSGAAVGPVLRWLEAEVASRTLAKEIEQGAAAISELVGAVKEHTHLDRTPRQEVDIHDGLESTLVMLKHKLRGGVEVVRAYDRGLTRITAYPGELNQVWTNLIDNAVDAMGGQGRIQLRTWREADRAVVEIADSGPGIPPEVLERIWEPFFTTKGVGEGTGLGLDIARRIVVDRHQGDIRLESEPGNTRFQVRLPIEGDAFTP